MKLTENQLKSIISETAKRVLSEIGYHEKQKRDQSEEEHEAWLRKKSAAKKRYYDSQKKDDDKGGAIDYYDYKHGKGNFRPAKINESSWFDNPLNAAAYDRWRTTDPREKYEQDMISKDDFFDIYVKSDNLDKGEKREFIEWLSGYDPDVYEKFSAELRASGQANLIAVAVNAGLDWHEIAREFLDVKPVEYYPGDLDESINRVVKNVIKETTLDYDMDNFSGRWNRGQRCQILVDGYPYYQDVPEESVDRLIEDLMDRLGYSGDEIEVVDL